MTYIESNFFFFFSALRIRRFGVAPRAPEPKRSPPRRQAVNGHTNWTPKCQYMPNVTKMSLKHTKTHQELSQYPISIHESTPIQILLMSRQSQTAGTSWQTPCLAASTQSSAAHNRVHFLTWHWRSDTELWHWSDHRAMLIFPNIPHDQKELRSISSRLNLVRLQTAQKAWGFPSMCSPTFTKFSSSFCRSFYLQSSSFLSEAFTDKAFLEPGVPKT